MKVYVDELPEDCLDGCVCFNNATGCEIGKGKVHCDYNKRPQNCPLQLLSDYTKQVRKDVCDEIKNWCNRNFNWVGDGTGYDGQGYHEMIGSNNTINKLREFLDQIQGE